MKKVPLLKHVCPPQIQHVHGKDCPICVAEAGRCYEIGLKEQNPPHTHCRETGCPESVTLKTVYRVPLFAHIFVILMALAFIYEAVLVRDLMNVQIMPAEPATQSYSVIIHDADPWKAKCQAAWKILNDDRDAGGAAFKVLDK